VDRRQKAPQGQHASVYVAVCGLQRFRDLRKAEDDFGFGRRGEERAATPSQNLTTILREGPGLGVHVLIWCDSLNNLNRSFERGRLGELEQGVLFKRSAGDSSRLIANRGASRWGSTGRCSTARSAACRRSSGPTRCRRTTGWAGCGSGCAGGPAPA